MRKPPIISAILGSVFIGGCLLAGEAMVEVKPKPKHVEVQIKCDSEPCKVSAK